MRAVTPVGTSPAQGGGLDCFALWSSPSANEVVSYRGSSTAPDTRRAVLYHDGRYSVRTMAVSVLGDAAW